MSSTSQYVHTSQCSTGQHSSTNGTFRTPDIHVSAFLMARGHDILGAEMESYGPHGVFVFPASVGEEADEFFRDGQVVAKRFANAIRELKAMVRHVTRGYAVVAP